MPSSQERAAEGWRRSLSVQIAVALTVVICVGVPTVGAEFIWDDIHQIIEAPALEDLGSVPRFFVTSLGVGLETTVEHEQLYQPMFSTWLTLIHQIGGADPRIYHTASLALHLVVVALLMALTSRWLPGWRWAALATGLLFGLQPASAEAWLFVSSSPDLLAACGLLGWVLVLECDRGRDEGRARIAWVALATTLATLGFLSKELALMGLPAWSGLLVAWRGVPWRRVAPAWGAALAFVGLRALVLDESAGVIGEPAQVVHHALLLPLDGLRALVMMPTGLRHLALDYEVIPPALAWLAGGVTLGLMAAATLVRRRQPLWLAALVGLVASLLPVAMPSTLMTWGGFSRYLYLPTLLVSLAVVGSMAALIRHRERAAPVLLAALVLVCGVQSMGLRQALADYADDRALVASEVRKNPGSWPARVRLADMVMESGDVRAAEEQYRGALAVNPDQVHARTSLALLLWQTRPEEALEEVQLAEEGALPSVLSHTVARLALVELGRWEEASARMVALRELDATAPRIALIEARILEHAPVPPVGLSPPSP